MQSMFLYTFEFLTSCRSASRGLSLVGSHSSIFAVAVTTRGFFAIEVDDRIFLGSTRILTLFQVFLTVEAKHDIDNSHPCKWRILRNAARCCLNLNRLISDPYSSTNFFTEYRVYLSAKTPGVGKFSKAYLFHIIHSTRFFAPAVSRQPSLSSTMRNLREWPTSSSESGLSSSKWSFRNGERLTA